MLKPLRMPDQYLTEVKINGEGGRDNKSDYESTQAWLS